MRRFHRVERAGIPYAQIERIRALMGDGYTLHEIKVYLEEEKSRLLEQTKQIEIPQPPDSFPNGRN